MQTFLPYRDFTKSAAALDRQRLGKQRVEVMQILRALRDGGGWANHPAVRMWRGCEAMLARYGLAICAEWVGRGYRDTCAGKIFVLAQEFPRNLNRPPWLGDEAFHRSHQSNLIRKDPEHYGHQFPGVPADLEYVWPVEAA